VRIDANVEEQPSGNRVKIKIDIKEGKRAKIPRSTSWARSLHRETDPGRLRAAYADWLSWYRRTIATPRDPCKGDLEKLRPSTWIGLRELRHRFLTGNDRAGEGRHLHHGEREWAKSSR